MNKPLTTVKRSLATPPVTKCQRLQRFANVIRSVPRVPLHLFINLEYRDAGEWDYLAHPRFPSDLNGGIPKGLRMSESSCIDSPLRGRAMPKSYSGDLRERVIEAVEGGASRRETAERFEVSVSSAVKWLQRWHESKSAVPKPRGGSVSPLEEFAEQILDLIAQQPDLTLVETVAELRKRRISNQP